MSTATVRGHGVVQTVTSAHGERHVLAPVARQDLAQDNRRRTDAVDRARARQRPSFSRVEVDGRSRRRATQQPQLTQWLTHDLAPRFGGRQRRFPFSRTQQEELLEDA